MSYNKGYDMSFDAYDKKTGTIAFPKDEWEEWYTYFIDREPLRFYAYIVRKSDNAFIGEVNIHKNEGEDWYEMGVILEAKYRGMGYSEEALRLLLKHAFEELNADSVRNDFEAERTAALHIHLKVGFTERFRENGIIELEIGKEQYWANRLTNEK